MHSITCESFIFVGDMNHLIIVLLESTLKLMVKIPVFNHHPEAFRRVQSRLVRKACEFGYHLCFSSLKACSNRFVSIMS